MTSRPITAPRQPPEQQPPPQQPPVADVVGCVRVTVPVASPTADHRRLTSACPSGHRTPPASAVTERCTSKMLSQVRQR